MLLAFFALLSVVWGVPSIFDKKFTSHHGLTETDVLDIGNFCVENAIFGSSQFTFCADLLDLNTILQNIDPGQTLAGLLGTWPAKATGGRDCLLLGTAQFNPTSMFVARGFLGSLCDFFFTDLIPLVPESSFNFAKLTQFLIAGHERVKGPGHRTLLQILMDRVLLILKAVFQKTQQSRCALYLCGAGIVSIWQTYFGGDPNFGHFPFTSGGSWSHFCSKVSRQ